MEKSIFKTIKSFFFVLDHRLPTKENIPVAAIVIPLFLVLIGVGIVLFVLYKKGILGKLSLSYFFSSAGS